MTPSPLLLRPGAVASPTEPTLAWHYGDPLAEQRRPLRLIDRWDGEMVTVTGPDRLTWMHALASQDLASLTDGESAEALWLSHRGHIEHWADVTDLDGTTWLRTEPEAAASLADYLRSMRFRADVEVRDVSGDWAGLSLAGAGATDAVDRAGLAGMTPFGGGDARGYLRPFPAGPDGAHSGTTRLEIVVAREGFAAVTQSLIDVGATPAGTWARDALAIAGRDPRFGVDTDARTLPNETPWLATAVNPDKGCYRGQETVTKIRTVGRPPRRLIILNLDGSADRLPSPGDDVTLGAGPRDSTDAMAETSGTPKVVGRVGTVSQHHEDGPIALALVKRTVAPGVPLVAGGVDALIDPDDAVADEPEVRIDRRQFYDFRRR